MEDTWEFTIPEEVRVTLREAGCIKWAQLEYRQGAAVVTIALVADKLYDKLYVVGEPWDAGGFARTYTRMNLQRKEPGIFRVPPRSIKLVLAETNHSAGWHRL